MTFAQHMIPHHRQALEMAELVQSRTTRPELVKLAGDITTTQGDEISRMQRWLQRWGKPEGMTAMDHHQMAMPGMMDHAEVGRFMGLVGRKVDGHGPSAGRGVLISHEEASPSLWSGPRLVFAHRRGPLVWGR